MVGGIFNCLMDFFLCIIFVRCCGLFIKLILVIFMFLIFIKYGMFVVLNVCDFGSFLFINICLRVFGWIRLFRWGFLLWWEFLLILFNLCFVFIFFFIFGFVYGREMLWLFSWFFNWVWKCFNLFVIFFEVDFIFNGVFIMKVEFWYL